MKGTKSPKHKHPFCQKVVKQMGWLCSLLADICQDFAYHLETRDTQGEALWCSYESST